MYRLYEWTSKWSPSMEQKAASNSLHGLMDTCHIDTNPCDWVIVSDGEIVAASSNAAAISWAKAAEREKE